ncbi:hypothetical protein VDG1235_1660 [Verrucomicrobiia bacterium DG1235]|nr:hypothetical protein VDG1235_1660 [Verrucomicrobiae bacterium DG1235]
MKIVDIDRPDRPKSPYGLRWYVNRKAKHLFFETKNARKTHRKKLESQAKREGSQSTLLKAWEVRDYLKARKKLEGSELTVLEAVEKYLELKPSDESLKDLSEAISEYLEVKERAVSQPHYRQIKRTLDFFQTTFSETVAIASSDIADWLNGLPYDPQTKQNYRKRLNAFFGYCVRQDWIQNNPIRGVEPPEVIPTEIGVLTPIEANYLFRANHDAPAPVLARFALEAFAGLRYSSACRIDFVDIKWELKGIELPAAKIKTKRRHFIDGLPDNLWRWLEFCRAQSEDWRIEERNYLYHKSTAFEKATLLFRQENGGQGEVPHPKNALRHSFASYHVALNKSPSATATILCHNSEKKLWDHYKGRATESDGEKYFGITPTKEN